MNPSIKTPITPLVRQVLVFWLEWQVQHLQKLLETFRELPAEEIETCWQELQTDRLKTPPTLRESLPEPLAELVELFGDELLYRYSNKTFGALQ